MASSVVTGDSPHDDMAKIPAVDLAGRSMLAIVQAIPELESRTGRKATVIGGLAVLCRLGTWLPTSVGMVQVDVIEVTDSELSHLPEDETDRLAVLSHAWAIQTATPVRIRATSSSESATTEVVVRVAEPGPLIAMKLQSIMNRPVDKERTDLLDIVQLTLDRTAGPLARMQLGGADAQLATDARLHAHRWFVDLKDQTFRRIRELPEGAEIDGDTIQLVGELLLAELDRSDPPSNPAPEQRNQ
jgi:hypothetical protein